MVSLISRLFKKFSRSAEVSFPSAFVSYASTSGLTTHGGRSSRLRVPSPLTSANTGRGDVCPDEAGLAGGRGEGGVRRTRVDRKRAQRPPRDGQLLRRQLAVAVGVEAAQDLPSGRGAAKARDEGREHRVAAARVVTIARGVTTEAREETGARLVGQAAKVHLQSGGGGHRLAPRAQHRVVRTLLLPSRSPRERRSICRSLMSTRPS